MVWLTKCYIGQVECPEKMFELQDQLYAEGLFPIKIVLMGGDLVLMQPEDGESLEVLIKESAGVFQR